LRPQEVDRRPQRQKDERLIQDTRILPEKVRLIDTREGLADDQKSRILTQSEAHWLRVNTGLDLIMLDKDASPPVIKLLDYGKFKYEEEKRKKEQAKKNHERDRGFKEFYFGLNIGPHDYETKLNHIREALEKNYDVRIGVKKNRDTRMALKRYQTLEQAAQEAGFVLRRVLADTATVATAGKWNMGERSITIDLKKANQ